MSQNQAQAKPEEFGNLVPNPLQSSGSNMGSILRTPLKVDDTLSPNYISTLYGIELITMFFPLREDPLWSPTVSPVSLLQGRSRDFGFL